MLILDTPPVRPYNEWRFEGNCASLTLQQSDKIFFLRKGRLHREPAYSRYCMGCPVLVECFNYAVANEEKGVWGNSTEGQRSRLLPELILAIRRKALAEGWLRQPERFVLEPPPSPLEILDQELDFGFLAS